MAKKKAKAAGKVVTVLRTQAKEFADLLSKDMTIDEIIAKLKTSEKDSKKIANEILNRVCPELFLLGVAGVAASYNGEGDSGDINCVHALDIRDNYMQWPKNTEKFVEAITRAIWQFIPGGFEINDGSYGEITIKIPTNQVLCEHNMRVVEIESSSETFTF
jgi:hypothetical protein